MTEVAAPAAPAAPAPAAPAAPAPAAPAAPWHGVTDPEGAGYVSNKGWQSPADIIKSYQSAEKLIGRDPNTLVALPKPGDQAGWESVYAKLGRPETPDKYDLKAGLKEGAKPDDAFMGKMASTFHKAGLNPEQAKILATEYNADMQARAEQAGKDYELNVATDKKALLQEWGGGYERMMNAAQNAVATLEFSAPMVDALEHTLGYAGTMKFFAALGQKLGEDKFISGAGKGFGGTMTPAEAGAEISKLKMDATFQSTLRDKQHPMYKENTEKWSKLFALAYPEPAR